MRHTTRRMTQFPHELSGGMRQRVMIAIALACDPEVLIADEPTTALDVTIQAQILSLLAELKRERGMAMVLITHDFGAVAGVADRVAVMQGGRVVELDSVRAVMKAPRHPYTRALLRALSPGDSLAGRSVAADRGGAWRDGGRGISRRRRGGRGIPCRAGALRANTRSPAGLERAFPRFAGLVLRARRTGGGRR